ncbi:MAG: hypothetical protein NTY37_12655 [Methanothrix sp.]|nr:hypothetical protein [Methanothrix sp.]
MSELRKHYFLDEYCIIAAKRKKRPSDFLLAKTVAGDETVCPFCPGNEEMTPPAVAVYTEQGVSSDGQERTAGWLLRVFPNVFATMVPCPAPATAEWIALPGQGYHEVMRHFANLQEMHEDEGKSLAALLKKALGSMRSVLKDPSYNCMIFQLLFGYHLNIRIQPAISKIAGFERGTGVYINAVAPEQAAEEFRHKLEAI